jgi:hypothetical protein
MWIYIVECKVLTLEIMSNSIFRHINLHSLWKSTDVPKEYVASVFRIEENTNQEASTKQVASKVEDGGEMLSETSVYF